MGTRSKGPWASVRNDTAVLAYSYHEHPAGESKPSRRIRRAGRPYARVLGAQFIKLRATRAVERKLRQSEATEGVRHYRED